MPYACLFACSNALAWEMGDVDRRVRLAWQAGQMIGPFSALSFLAFQIPLRISVSISNRHKSLKLIHQVSQVIPNS